MLFWVVFKIFGFLIIVDAYSVIFKWIWIIFESQIYLALRLNDND